MQVVRAIGGSPEDYNDRARHETVRAPERCPNCGLASAPPALGYYSRGITNLGKVVRILVRRFRCRECGKTVSVLPSFAQPYRVVENRIIDAFFRAGLKPIELKWLPLLGSYRTAFERGLPELTHRCGTLLPRSPPFSRTAEWWQLIAEVLGELPVATVRLVELFQITLFGRYRCHSPSAR